jgi:predicted transcriptional regulator
MRTETIQYFTKKEEEFVNLLMDIGTKKNVAKLLVFLANVSPASSRAIERRTDMRQPEVSIAMKYLLDRSWVNVRGGPSDHKGRPIKIYELTVPFKEIMNSIEEEKKSEARNQLALIRKLRDHI